MSQSLASIGIKIESTDADTAAQRLDSLVEAGTAADKAVAQLGATSQAAAAQVASVSATAKQLTIAQTATNSTIAAATISSAQYAQALRLLPIQIHQAFDQLLYGTNPLIVLSTQVPQITESFGGVGNALKALGSAITPTAVGIGALAAAIGTVGYAWYEAAEQQDAFRKKLITTGDAVGLTADQLEDLAKQIQASGVSHGDAVTALTTALSAGITTNLKQISELAAQYQELAGVPIATTIKDFAALGDDPVKAAESLQRTLAFLTPQVLAEITALEKQGDIAKAAGVAQEQLTKSLSDQVEQLKATQGGWEGVGHAVKNYFSNTISEIGQQLNPGLTAQIKEAQERLANVKESAAASSISAFLYGPEVKSLQAQLDALEAREAKAKAFASTGQQNASATNAKIQGTPQTQASLTAGLAATSIFQSIADTAQSDAIQRSLAAELAATQRYDQLLDAEHSAHLISDEAYYAEKGSLIDKDTEATITALNAQNEALGKQIAQVEAAAAHFNSLPHTPAEITKNNADAAQKVASLTEKIADNNAKIAETAADGANKVKLLGDTYKSVYGQAAATLANFQASEDAYLKTLTDNYNLQLQGITAGPAAKQRLQDIAQVNAQYAQQVAQLNQAKRINPELPNYDAQLQAIEETHKKALADTDAYYRTLDGYQSDWLTGAKAALNTYEESAHTIADQVQGTFTDAFSSLEDVFVNFATTGKLTFKNFADSVIGDIARMVAKQEISSIASLFRLGGGGGGIISDLGLIGSTIGFAASGGPISGPTVVGEKGPEVFIPDTSGYVIPNNKLAAMMSGGAAPVINISYGSISVGAGVDRATMLSAMDITRKQTIAQVSNLINGGAFSR